MGAIGISATLPDSNPYSIYKAVYPAICLSSLVKLGEGNTPVSFSKLLPTGEEIVLSSLQGVFFGEGSALLATASPGCHIEVTLVSQSVEKEHQIIYPAPQPAIAQFESTIDTNICNTCLIGARVMTLDTIPGGQVRAALTVKAPVTSESTIKVYKWLVEPKCPPLVEGTDVETIATLPSNGGWFYVTMLSSPTIVSFFAQNSNQNNAYDLACFTAVMNLNVIEAVLEAFPGESGNASGRY